jgi:AcrR family transcriptional regulator
VLPKNNSENTKERILDSAELLFAKGGYNGVSIREITDIAHCNQASVHYHFGSKENLYLEVFRTRWLPREKAVVAFFEDALRGLKNPAPDKVVEAFARAYVDGPLTDTERQRQRLLVVRELANPGEAFDLVADQIMLPISKLFLKFLKPFLAKGVTEKDLTLHVLGIAGMVFYFTYSRTLISRVLGSEYTHRFKKNIIQKIVSFSLDGLPLRKSIGDD